MYKEKPDAEDYLLGKRVDRHVDKEEPEVIESKFNKRLQSYCNGKGKWYWGPRYKLE